MYVVSMDFFFWASGISGVVFYSSEVELFRIYWAIVHIACKQS